MVEELATVNELHNQVKALSVLEGILEAHDERMIKLLKNLSLHYDKKLVRKIKEILTSDASNLISLDKQVFQNRLHRVNLLSDVVLDQVDFAVGATADSAQYLEVTFLNGGLRGGTPRRDLAVSGCTRTVS